MAYLNLEGVSKSYGKTSVLRDINLAIDKGELIVFVGPSGCGKSTLLRMIAGLEEITAGNFVMDGVAMNEIPPAQRAIAMVFQSYALYPHMSVYDNMSFGMKIAKLDKKTIAKKIGKAAGVLQLEPYLDRLPKELSGGQRQRVAIGRAIVREPKVFLFDEPLSNLDAALRVAMRIEIAQLKEKMPDNTMIYVTHDQVEAMTLASRIVVLHDGDVEQFGEPMELYETPANIFVAQFIGSPAMNVFPGKLTKTGKLSTIKLDKAGGGRGSTVVVPIASVASDKGKKVHLGVRPEDLIITKGKDYVFEGKVNLAEGLGEVTLVYFDEMAGDSNVIAKVPGTNQGLKKGAVIRFSASAEKLHLFDSAGISFLHRHKKQI